MASPKVSIIIVNWNGGQVFKNCLSSLKKLSYPNWELIIVDNGSTDSSIDYVRKLAISSKYFLPNTKYNILINDENIGFASGNNLGVKLATGKYILLLNNDTKTPTDFLSVLVKKMESDTNIGALQPKIKIMDKPSLLDNCGTYLTGTGFLEHWGFLEKDGKQFGNEKDIFSAKGACLLTRADIVKKIGLFDADFQSYFEESDFCWRVWLAGWEVKYVPDTFIYHKVGYSSKRMSQIEVNYHSLKNRICSLYKNLDNLHLFTILIPHLAIIKALGIYYLVTGQFEKSKMVFAALIWNVRNIVKSHKKRIIVQKLRHVDDQQIFNKIMHKVNWQEMFSHFQKVEANFK